MIKGGKSILDSINLENQFDFPPISLRDIYKFNTNSINSILLNDPIGNNLPPRLI
mgnify:CR=1 FL=1